MDIKYLIENEYMKCVLQINGFSGPRPRVQSNRRVGSNRGGGKEMAPRPRPRHLFCYQSLGLGDSMNLFCIMCVMHCIFI